MKFLNTINQRIENIPFGAAIFMMLLFQKLSPILSGGEEQYLAYAKQYMNPDWIKNSFSVSEQPGSRLLFQFISGTLLSHMSFTSFMVLARCFNFLLFSFALDRLFKKISLPKLWALLVFQLYILSSQSFFGGEWIFGSFEPKTLAYACLLFALPYLLEKRIIISVLLLALGTYFHFLVTGWFIIALSIYWILSKEFKLFTQFSVPFLLLCTPFFIHLYTSVLSNSASEINGVNLNWVYCYERLPHHLGIASSWTYFSTKRLPGILMAGSALIFLYKFRDKFESLSFFRDIVIISISLALIFVLFALADSFVFNQQAFFILKTYPFRGMAIALFFTSILATHFISQKLFFLQKYLGLFLIIFFVSQTARNYEYYSIDEKRINSFEMMKSYIKANTEKDDVFVLQDTPHWLPEKFIRLTEREAIYIRKFTPAETQKLYDWAIRSQDISLLVDRKLPAPEIHKKYGATYLLTQSAKDIKDLNLVKNDENFLLYEIVNP